MTRILYPQRFEPIRVAAAAETVTLDKWNRGLSEPVRRVGLAIALIVASGAIISPWALTQAEAVTADRWVQPPSQPTLRVKDTGWRQTSFFAPASPFTETVSADRWAQPPSQPTLAKRRTQPDSVYYSYYVAPAAETVTLDKWFSPLREPVRFRLSLPAYEQQALAFVKADPFPESVTYDRWASPLSEPVRFRRGLPTWEQQTTAFTQFNIEAVTLDKWYSALREPVRVRPALRSALQQTTAHLLVAPFAEAVSLDRWLQPLSEPQRFRQGLPSREQQTFAFVKAGPFAESVTLDRWLQPIAQPYPAKRYVAYQQTLSFWPFPLPNLDAPVGFWPIYPERALGRRFPTQEQQTLAFVKAAPFGESVTLDRWMQALASPVRTFRHLSLALYESAAHFDPLPILPVQTITDTDILQLPVDCVLAGQQPYEFSGRDPVIPAKYSESKGPGRSRVKRLTAPSSSTTRSGSLSGSHKE